MSKPIVLALVAAGSLFAGAALAGETTTKDASKPATASKAAKSKTAATPKAGAASATTSSDPTTAADVVAMAPVPDTKENRAAYGKPLSRMGRQTAARGN